MMSRIYSDAERTLIWLGPVIDGRGEALRAFSDWQKSGHFEVPVFVGSNLGYWFQILCDHLYWTRAWIVQECILAKHLELQLGKFRVDLTRQDLSISVSE